MSDFVTMLEGDCRDVLPTLPSGSVHCVVTSPPYWGLRDYGVAGQLGLEKTPEEYVEKMVRVFREVRRVLRDDGTLWLNMGDSYGGAGGAGFNAQVGNTKSNCQHRADTRGSSIKPKDLVGIPWRLAFALQADGWYLRSDIIWHKPNPMPESVTDRPTKAHEYVFLLSKSASYYYDHVAIQEPSVAGFNGSEFTHGKTALNGERKGLGLGPRNDAGSRNKRSVWTIATEPFSEAHFATFPTALVKPCILAGTSARGYCPKCGAPWEREVNRVPAVSKPCPKTTDAHLARGGTGVPVGTVGKSGSGRIDGFTETLGWYPSCRCNNDDDDCEVDPIPCTVLDPFGGSGTVGQVALELGRKAILIELNPKYVELARSRTFVTPGLQLA